VEVSLTRKPRAGIRHVDIRSVKIRTVANSQNIGEMCIADLDSRLYWIDDHGIYHLRFGWFSRYLDVNNSDEAVDRI
jgi:hypothetical protein